MSDFLTTSSTVTKVLYKSEDFCIIKCLDSHLGIITIKGDLENPYVGQILKGDIIPSPDPVYGMQYENKNLIPHLSYDLDSLVAFLGSGRIKGIGKVLAKRLGDHFNQELIPIFRNETFEKLSETPGISSQKIESIKSSWQKQKALSDILVFFKGKGISLAYGTRIYKFYKEGDPLLMLQKNPYYFIGKIPGIGFSIMDSIAQKMNFLINDKRRISAAILFACNKNRTIGNIYITHEELISQVESLVGEDLKHLIYEEYEELCNSKILICLKNSFVGFYEDYYKEIQISIFIKEKRINPSKKVTLSFSSYLDSLQQNGITTALENTVSIITGPPGSGKTTIIKEIVAHEKGKILLAAPTGRAAQRMNEKIGLPSYTIHRLLEWDPVSNMCMKNKHHPLDADIIIIDEASMIDLEMMTRIADAIKNSCRLVLLGDADQLPSVSHGCILRDFIQSKQIPTVRLQKIFRQEKNSAIIDTACSIKNGSMPKFLNDCLFISESKPENFLPRIQALINEKYGKSISLSDVQILTPLYKGKAGAHNLNQNVQKNSSSQDHIPFFRKFRLHDKVIQLNNDYENNVYNGDLGIIKSYDEENETITVDFSNKTILYDNETFHTIELAYAITIHKSQGSEFPIIAIPIFMEHFIMLNRQLIYTAITRAKELCILVGEKRALACAIKKEEATHRKTYLQNLLQE